MPELASVLSTLGQALDTCVACHSVLMEWKDLHDLLQNLEWLFKPLVLANVQGKRIEEINEHLPEIQRAWRICGNVITTQLVPFAEKIQYIGVPYREENGHLFGEEWIVHIVQKQRTIDEALGGQMIRSLKEHICKFDSDLAWYLGFADDNLQANKTDLLDLLDRLVDTVSRIEAWLADSDEAGSKEFLGHLLKDLQELTRMQACLLEWIQLHHLLQRLQSDFGHICIAGQKPEKKLDQSDFDFIASALYHHQKIFSREFLPFAESVIHVGAAIAEGGAVELVQKQRRIAEALEEVSRPSVRSAIIEMDDAYRKNLRIVNDELKAMAEDLDRLTYQLRGRVGQ